MKVSIHSSQVKGRVSAPPSKSYTIRGLMCAALAKGESNIIFPLDSDDTRAARSVLGQTGISIEDNGDRWHVSGGNLHRPDNELFCGESAATLRFMTAIASLIPGECRLTAGPYLGRRPIKPLIQALNQLGANCSYHGDTATVTVSGGLRGGIAELPGDISSQFISALLLVSPLATEGVIIRLTTAPESKPFLLMTLDCLQSFGIKVSTSPNLREFEVAGQSYQPTEYQVEGDWSSASYPLALGAVAGEVTVDNLNPASRQGDRTILDFLKEMGARVKVDGNCIMVRKANLTAIRADLSDCIDLLPTIAVLAATASGTSELTGIARARLKESDRVAAVKDGLERMGIMVIEARDSLTITGSRPRGSLIDTRDDHRIAMAFSIPGLLAGETIIDSAECVAKTFPGFWDMLGKLGVGMVTETE